jgi:SPX domain protein involved in polyphosphate accumulation
VYFNINFTVFFKLIKMHLLVSELYILKTNFLLHLITHQAMKKYGELRLWLITLEPDGRDRSA